MAISGDDFQEQVPVLVSHVCPNSLKWLYRFCNDICVHFISTGCSTLTRTRWVVACHTWTRTNHTWQNWVGISIFLIKMGEKSKKAFLKGRSRFFFPSSSSSFFSTRPAAQLFLGLKRLSASNGVLGSMKAWLLRDPFNTFGGYHRIRVEGHTHTHKPYVCGQTQNWKFRFQRAYFYHNGKLSLFSPKMNVRVKRQLVIIFYTLYISVSRRAPLYFTVLLASFMLSTFLTK